MLEAAKAFLPQRRIRHLVVIAVDGILSALSIVAAVHLRTGANKPDDVVQGLAVMMPVFTCVALATFYFIGLYRRVWRYTSLADLIAIMEAVSLAIVITVMLLLAADQLGWMPRSIPVIQWFVLIVLMGGVRMSRRLWSEYRRLGAKRPLPAETPGAICQTALLVGNCDRVELVLRSLEASNGADFIPLGILDDVGSHLRLEVRGVPILGSVEMLEQVVQHLDAKGMRPGCLILTETVERLRGSAMVGLVTRAESLGLKVACVSKLTEVDHKRIDGFDLRFLNLAELLGRPQARMDVDAVADAITGKRVLVTGAGGTIGSELVRQIAALKPAKLVLLDNCEFNLYSIDLEIGENHADLPRVPVLCSIFQRSQLMMVFEEHRPELVFHAAALKHVPLVEQYPCAGVQTNVLGTRNVADAAKCFKVQAMVQVSTDKAVNPVGLMGATKRLGELYCQALDIEGHGKAHSSRFLTVRFGNVIGSSGSLIPLFQRQLSRGSSLTVTHPDIKRYFMTVHEAVQLILQSTASAVRQGVTRGRIFVLDMGEPVKIIDIARRMIRLAGLEPDVDVKIDIVGLRPGEKLYEELFDSSEERLASAIPGIFEAEPSPVPLSVLNETFDELAAASAENDVAMVQAIVKDLVVARRQADVEAVRFVQAKPPRASDVATHAA